MPPWRVPILILTLFSLTQVSGQVGLPNTSSALPPNLSTYLQLANNFPLLDLRRLSPDVFRSLLLFFAPFFYNLIPDFAHFILSLVPYLFIGIYPLVIHFLPMLFGKFIQSLPPLPSPIARQRGFLPRMISAIVGTVLRHPLYIIISIISIYYRFHNFLT